MYGITNYGKLFADKLTEWLLETGFVESRCQKSIYYRYIPDETKIIVIPYIDDCFYWLTSEALVKWFVENLGKRFHVIFLGFAHLLMSISISQIKDHSISIYQYRYATFILDQYIDTATVKKRKIIYNTTFPYDMIFKNCDV